MHEFDVLPMVQVTVALDGLRREVDEVAAKEEPVPGLDGKGVAHKGGRVADKSTGHATGDTIRRKGYVSLSIRWRFRTDPGVLASPLSANGLLLRYR